MKKKFKQLLFNLIIIKHHFFFKNELKKYNFILNEF